MPMRSLLLTMLFLLSWPGAMHAAQPPDDHEALSGLQSAKVIFDVRVTDLDKLLANLRLFNETFEGMVAQDVKPEMITVFRGPGVKLLSSAPLDEEVAALLRSLHGKGVRFEICAVAMRIYKAAPEGLPPELQLVANVFNSLIGYQNKGYAMIAIN